MTWTNVATVPMRRTTTKPLLLDNRDLPTRLIEIVSTRRSDHAATDNDRTLTQLIVSLADKCAINNLVIGMNDRLVIHCGANEFRDGMDQKNPISMWLRL